MGNNGGQAALSNQDPLLVESRARQRILAEPMRRLLASDKATCATEPADKACLRHHNVACRHQAPIASYTRQ